MNEKIYTHSALVVVEFRNTGQYLDHRVVQAISQAAFDRKLAFTLADLAACWVPASLVSIEWRMLSHDPRTGTPTAVAGAGSRVRAAGARSRVQVA